MTDLPDWAKDRARAYFYTHHWVKESAEQLVPSLATLLVEVANGASEAEAGRWISSEVLRNENVIVTARERALAEVRRVVEEIKQAYTSTTSGCADAPLCCDEILARLDKLK